MSCSAAWRLTLLDSHMFVYAYICKFVKKKTHTTCQDKWCPTSVCVLWPGLVGLWGGLFVETTEPPSAAGSPRLLLPGEVHYGLYCRGERPVVCPSVTDTRMTFLSLWRMSFSVCRDDVVAWASLGSRWRRMGLPGGGTWSSLCRQVGLASSRGWSCHIGCLPSFLQPFAEEVVLW